MRGRGSAYADQEKELVISTKIFVGNLSFSTTREELTNLLAEAGRVVDVRLPTDRETGRPRGFAFVEFSNEDECAAAIARFNDREVAGRRLKVNPAEDRPPSRGPGGGPPPRRSFGGPPPVASDGGFADEGSGFTFGGAARPLKNKGSRRGVRGRKRSLNY